MRGEDLFEGCDHGYHAGSPPHARGRRRQNRRQALSIRITPACAGKTGSALSRAAPSRDHPRMRGEDLSASMTMNCGDGSPPHARGRPRQKGEQAMTPGITPACAGKTRRRRQAHSPTWDHPRMRGEDAAANFPVDGLGGSPPHARGRQGQNRGPCRRERITPACAGKTCR